MPEPIPVTQAEEPEQQAIPVEKTAGSPPPQPIKVTRAQVAAAKLRLKLDKDRGLPPDPAWEAVASASWRKPSRNPRR